ncbi:MAG: hypothetical protein HYV90_04885 [Candidatus Woesebacteria bacterium]|nr:MAG: hypothetical protein HYV90_04885 [Candidatus Woesebacteria bacterium]
MKQEILFAEAKNLKTEFTFSKLDPEEKEIVAALVSWSNPAKYTGQIEQLHGRSVVIKSPTRHVSDPTDFFMEKYDGIQIFGFGGARAMIREGVAEVPSKIEITQLNETNHSNELAAIIQLRDFDDKGRLKTWNRPYAPMHGMDQTEAKARKAITVKIADYHSKVLKEQGVPFFSVPEFVAEGFFPDKKDPSGNPLVFQAYRVPIIDRFPSQLIQTAQSESVEIMFHRLQTFSFLAGRFFRTLHQTFDLAYMDGHLGNMSLLRTEKKAGIYATDLGSAKDIKSHPFAEKFRGIDIYTYIATSRSLMASYAGFLEARHGQDKAIKDFQNLLTFISISGLASGYFETEITKGENMSTIKVIKNGEKFGNDLMKIFSPNSSPQVSLDMFEVYLKEITENN